MLTVDYIILAVFLVSVVVGLFRGFFREALSLATWMAAVWVALNYSSVMEPLLASVSSPALRFWAAKLLVFLLVLIAGGLVNHLIHVLVAKTGLSGTDRVLGMVFGAARGVLVVGLLVMVMGLLEMDQETWWEESRLISYAEPMADKMRGLVQVGLDRLEDAVAPSGEPAEPEAGQ